MKENKVKSHRNQLALQFKQKCKQILKQQPKNYLSTSIKDNHITIDVSIFTPQDIPFFQVMLGLPIHKLTVCTPDPNDAKSKSPNKNKNKDPQAIQIKTFPETPKFRQFMAVINQAIENNPHLKMVRIQRIPLNVRALKQLKQGIKRSKSLRQLAMVSCNLTEDHIEVVKQSLAENTSLMTIDFSFNALCDVGGMIGHILAEHSRRRNDVVFILNVRGQMPADDLSNSGLCEVNLQHNKLTDKSIAELVTYLKADSWTKCLNLRNNFIKSQGIKELALMLKNNSSLISLDLRGNQGLSREYSRFIYKKLVLNMQKYKQKKQLLQKSKTLHKENDSNNHDTPSKSKQIEHIDVQLNKYKSAKQNFYVRYDSKQYTTIAEPSRQIEKNNMTLDRKIKINSNQSKLLQPECQNCKAKTFEMLRLQKKNLDLELQLRKVKHALLTKNVDISAILPNSNNQSVIDWLSNKSHQNDDELLQRMQQIMMELTRVIETIQEHQNTKENLTNPLDNPNSFSNTLQLYEKNSQLQDLSKQIDEEERLRAVLEGSHSLEHKIDVLESSQVN